MSCHLQSQALPFLIPPCNSPFGSTALGVGLNAARGPAGTAELLSAERDTVGGRNAVLA
jgi:hypothetical protein